MADKKNRSIAQSKLITLLKSLNKQDLRSFSDFVRSPFFNKHKDVIQLFEILKKDHPSFEKDLSKIRIYKRLFSKNLNANKQVLTAKEDKTLRYVMNYLTASLQTFLMITVDNNKQVQKQHALARAYLSKGVYKYVPGIIEYTNNLAQKQRQKGPQDYYDRYLIGEVTLHYHLITQNRTTNAGMQNLMDQFYEFYLVNQLRYYCAAINRENILQVTYQYPDMDHLIEQVDQKDFSHIPMILIYYRILLMLRGRNAEEQYAALMILLNDHEEEFILEEIQAMYGFAINYCTAKIKQGDRSYLVKKNEIYKRTFPNNVWTLGDYIIVSHYVLAVKTAIVIRDFEWIELFVESYKTKLQPRFQTSIPYLCKAYIAFYKEDLETAHQLLLKIGEPEDFFFELYYRLFLIQIYYEKSFKGKVEDYEDPLHNALEALRFYISPTRNKNMSENNRMTYSNFMKLTKRLFRIRFYSLHNKDFSNQIIRLKKDVLEATFLAERFWLLEKIEELNTRFNA